MERKIFKTFLFIFLVVGIFSFVSKTEMNIVANYFETQSHAAEEVEVKKVNSVVENIFQRIPDPVTLRINSIKLSAPIVETGLEPDGSLHVPSSPDLAGWYKLGPKPGDIGPSVLTGHSDSKAGPGVFYNLKKVRIGEEIVVVRDDGSLAVFLVVKLEEYPQNNFATESVYGDIKTSGLRIITCSGKYNKKTKRYSHNLVVYANLKEIQQPSEYEPL